MSTPNSTRGKPPPAPAGPKPGHAESRLTERIVGFSVADTWTAATAEWDLAEVWFDRKQPGVCLCGKEGIVEHCLILNRETGVGVIVGIVCVGRFMGIPVDPLFRAFRRIFTLPGAGMSPDAVRHAHDRGWVSDRELEFCRETFGKPGLSPKQSARRRVINGRVARRLGEVAHAHA